MLRRISISLILAILTLALFGQPSRAQDSSDNSMSLFLPIVSHDPATLCRFGVNKDISNFNLSPLRTGWFINYGATFDTDKAPAGVSYLPTIRLTQTGPNSYTYSVWANWTATSEKRLKEEIARHPGAEWFIGNEPDRRDRTVAHQDDIEPQVYAKAYHDLYEIIKTEDPTATIIAGSIVQPTEVRLKYLDKVLAAYKQEYGTLMPVDVWATHNFILNEVSCEVYPGFACWGADIPPGIDDDKGMVIAVDQNDDFDIFKAQIVRFRQWLAQNGYRGAPIYVSEYGVLFGPENGWPEYDVARVNRFMDATFDYMLNTTDTNLGDPSDGYRMVQRFSWYSVRDTHFNGSLFAQNGALTAIGSNYAAYTSGITGETDFYPVEFTANAIAASGPDATSAVKLTATIANSGNVGTDHAATVRFYNNNPAGKGVQIGPDQTVRLAGCGQDIEVSYEWNQSKPGLYNLFVVVEPTRTGRESDSSNNTRKTTVTVGSGAAAPSALDTAANRVRPAIVPGP